MKSSPTFTASTYAFVAASCACVGSVTFTIREVFTSTTPLPFGSSEIFPFVFVDVIAFPLTVKLSTVTAVNAPVLGVDAPIAELLIAVPSIVPPSMSGVLISGLVSVLFVRVSVVVLPTNVVAAAGRVIVTFPEKAE